MSTSTSKRTFTNLPAELKRSILSLVSDSASVVFSRDEPGDLFTISHVCQEWRYVALEDLKPWQLVQLDTVEDCRALISLVKQDAPREGEDAGEEDKSIVTDKTGQKERKQTSSYSVDLGARIKTLVVGEDVEQDGPQGGAELRQVFPLDELLVLCANARTLMLRGVADGAASAWLQSPNLHHLRLTTSQIQPIDPPPRCENVTELAIVNSSVHPPLRAWLSDTSLPNLVALSFHGNSNEEPMIGMTPWLQMMVAGCKPLRFDRLSQFPTASLKYLFVERIWAHDDITELLASSALVSLDCDQTFAEKSSRVAKLPLTLVHLRLRALSSQATENDVDDLNDGQGHSHDKIISVVLGELNRLGALEQIYHPLGWTARAGYGELKHRCDSRGVSLVSEPLVVDGPDADERFWVLVRKLEG